MPIQIDDSASPTFQKALRELSKQYRHVGEDLKRAYEAISADPWHACNARRIPGTSHELWKYRVRSSDRKRGGRGGFRLIAYRPPGSDVLYPLIVYTHSQYEGQPPDRQIKRAIESLLGSLPGAQPGLFDGD